LSFKNIKEKHFMPPKETFLCRVKKYRLARGWSQDELAQHVGVRRQAVYDIESGRYLPNTAVAIRLARTFDCKVEDLFVEQTQIDTQPVHLIGGKSKASTRLALGLVRGNLIGIPLQGPESIPFCLRSADGLLTRDGKNVQILASAHRLDKTIILMGCDPAFEILSQHITRMAANTQVHCRFASSVNALNYLGDGVIHVAGTHLHNTSKKESNVVMAGKKITAMGGYILGFSLLEEGLMVAKDNPLGIRNIADLAQPMVRFVNREPGAALRILLDDHLKKAGIDTNAVNGYTNEVFSHGEGAYRIACNVADAALGLRVIAEAYNLGFVPMAIARCDLVIPADLNTHPTIKILLDVLQSSGLRKEIDAISGYEGSVTGKTIAKL
jgi:putative molybdopterin biosynthesis protein